MVHLTKLTSFFTRTKLCVIGLVFSIISGGTAMAQDPAPKAHSPLDQVTALWPGITGSIIILSLLAWALIAWYLHYKPMARLTEQRLKTNPRCFVANLTAEYINRLTTAGCDFSSATVQNQKGIVFAASNLDQVLQALQARLIAALPSGEQDLAFIVLQLDEESFQGDHREVPSEIVVQRTAGLFNLSRRRYENFLMDAVEPIASAIIGQGLKGRRVWLNHQEEDYYRERQKASRGQFSLLLPAGGFYLDGQTNPSTLYGFKPSPATKFYKSDGKALPIKDPVSGVKVAEVTEDSLILYYDAFTARTEEELTIFARVLQAAVQELNPRHYVESILTSLPLPAESLSLLGKSRDSACAVFEEGLDIRRGYIAQTMLRCIMVPALQCDIYLKDCQGSAQTLLSDGMYHIYLDSSPYPSERIAAPTKLFGIPRVNGAHSFLPSGHGLPLVSSEGDIYGEIMPDNFYVYLSDALGRGSRADAEFFARMMLHAREMILLEAQSDDAAQSKLLHAEKLGQYGVSLLADQSSSRVNGLQTQASTLKETERALTDTLNQLIAEQKDLSRLDSYPQTALGAEFDSILSISKVREVEVTKTKIVVKTDVLYCVDPRSKKRHEIGKFDITIQVGYTADDLEVIRWINKTRTVTTPASANMNAPHVSSQGAACMGNAKGAFPLMVQKREFAAAVEMAIAFIESVNVGDTWGKHVDCWPVADDDGEEESR